MYACNHSSNLEAPAVFVALRRLFPRLRVLYTAELRRLPVLVWLFDVEGWSHEEIAHAFERTVSFSKSQLARGHARLRAELLGSTRAGLGIAPGIRPVIPYRSEIDGQ